ncbi:MAG TPA: radical SAM family heme chaperone HemW [Steroidobacteraceae bacterium]|jgi:oxygen-independent coproporphyrinogen-3 oxidase
MPDLPPLSLYLHFPWCVRKCPYCDFNSHALQGALPEAEYVDALLRDLTLQLSAVQGRVVQSIFMGGGTPSLFSPAAIERLLLQLRARLALASDAEITLEANPGTIERGQFSGYRRAGITRVSLGAQSFAPAQLQRLGRIHDAGEIARAVAELRASGLHNFNLDLMYGLPQQTLAQALEDLEQAIALQPPHLSHYQLSIEPGTVFAGRPPAGLPDSDHAAELQAACQDKLAQSGYAQYEISAYAKAGARCRHNLNYWQFGDYLGVGAGAHGKFSALRQGALVMTRSTRTRDPRRYLAQFASDQAAAGPTPGSEQRVVVMQERAFEFLLNALRLVEGFEQAQLPERTGVEWSSIAADIERARRLGLLEQRGTRWAASPRGLNFLNDLLALFLPRPSNRARLKA